jgi:hypothetical protein
MLLLPYGTAVDSFFDGTGGLRAAGGRWRIQFGCEDPHHTIEYDGDSPVSSLKLSLLGRIPAWAI